MGTKLGILAIQSQFSPVCERSTTIPGYILAMKSSVVATVTGGQPGWLPEVFPHSSPKTCINLPFGVFPWAIACRISWRSTGDDFT
ncbi:hypothetical protein NG796_25700 [Laspinema sp. A4]|uniref:hypothetical protein n=1 Tax=Laspinema sp. D2d TaxID=2953686 RepID=UPI0021BB222C|nr:hypothetical protein [Laspinema sp. D2d]MCT7986672.1 hypothetical protein [Laspinema sp. D2d]